MRCSHLGRFGSWPRGCQAILATVVRFFSVTSSSSGRSARATIVVGFFLIVKEVAQPLLVAAQERIELLDAGEVKPGGAAERERGQALRVAHGELGGDPAAERQPDQVHVLELQLVEHVEIEIGEVVDVIEPVRRVGLAKARMFRRDDVEFFRQLLHERQHIRARRAVQNNERAAGPATHQPDAAAADRKHRRRKIRHGGSLEICGASVKRATALSSSASARLGGHDRFAARRLRLPLPRGERDGVRGFGKFRIKLHRPNPSSCPSPLWGEGTQLHRPRKTARRC